MRTPGPAPPPDYSVFHDDDMTVILILAAPDTAPAEVALAAHRLFTESHNKGFTLSFNHR